MIRTKTLAVPFASAVLATLPTLAPAAVQFELNLHKTYRQNPQSSVVFRGGEFETFIRDGDGLTNCESLIYLPPSGGQTGCSAGTNGMVVSGTPDPDNPDGGPYFFFTSVVPASVIEPFRADLCILKAAPASDLARPSGGFTDKSFSLFYNLHQPAAIRKFQVTRYEQVRTYGPSQLSKFENEIVPGTYYYSLPALGKADTAQVVAPATIFPMAEGFAERHSVKSGVRFLVDNTKWNPKGFLELSTIKPNVIRWNGFTTTNAFAGVDFLYFSLRHLTNPKRALSPVTYTNPDTGETPSSVFPSFENGEDPKILLPNPYVTEFTLPPIFPGDTRAVIELELDRFLATGGISRDFSTRKFQLPVIFVNRYTDYADVVFANPTAPGTELLSDFDRDGFNNLTEWILDSQADDSASVPKLLLTEPRPNALNPYYGFTVMKKLGTVPLVKYILQRSKDGGKTFQTFSSDADWTVTNTKKSIKVETANGRMTQPPGTESDLYRVKIVLK